MPISRKAFLKQGMRGAFVLALGKSLRPLNGFSFVLPPSGASTLRFALVSDGHFGQPDTGYELHHHNAVNWLNEIHKERPLDFVMVNGDLIHNEDRFLGQAKESWDKLAVPYYVSHGNHDQTNEITWQNTWKMSWHHAFECKGTGFLILNTADEKGEYICPDLAWTREQLAKFEKHEHLFVFMHITPFTWTKGGHACPELTRLFQTQRNLKFIFHGHDHDQDGVMENGGQYYFFDSHIAGNWGTEYRGYRVVELMPEGGILTYQMNPLNNQKVNSTVA